MTCNLGWNDILDDFSLQEVVPNHPNSIAHIFITKLEYLKHKLFKREIFGKFSICLYN